MLFKLTVYGYQCGIYSSRKLEETCRYRVDFMWPLEEKPVPDDIRFAGEQRGKVLAKVREKVLESTGRTATINLQLKYTLYDLSDSQKATLNLF